MLIIAAVLAVRPQPAARGSAAVTASACRHVRGPFRVAGGHMVTGSGSRFTPYGVNTIGLHKSSATFHKREVDAIAADWCSNVVRFLVLQERLIPKAEVNHSYLTDIEDSVRQAEARGLAVILGLDQEASYAPRLPVERTLQAWRTLTYHFGRNPQVIFDIFNEPSGGWRLWRNGGRSGGRVYYGMQRIARLIRDRGGRNLLWVQGHARANTLQGIIRWKLWGVGPVAYVVHRPPTPRTAASWTRSFGFLTIRYRYPVVEGEWANYSRAGAPWACWPNARVTVPRFLSYLKKHKIGLVAFDLSKPRLLQSPSFTDPNRIRSNFACRNGLNQGAGNQIKNWIARRNGGA